MSVRELRDASFDGTVVVVSGFVSRWKNPVASARVCDDDQANLLTEILDCLHQVAFQKQQQKTA